MTKSRKRRTGSSRVAGGCGGYQANVIWVTRPGTGMPDCHSENRMVDPTRPGEEGTSYLERSPFRSVHTRLPQQQCDGTGSEKSAEAVVARPGEGPNL